MNPFSFFKKIFKGEEHKEEVDLLQIPLEKLKKGDIIELEGESWEVVDIALYDYGASKEKEWEIRSAKNRGFLSLEEGKIYFFLEIDSENIQPNPQEHYRKYKNPPEEITVGGKKFKLKYAGKAKYVKNLESYPVIIWEFKNEDGEMIDVEIWDEYEVEVFKGRELKEWEIESILPR
ncbi:MAG TPA: DUF4178 domain-containing protein [Aquifex aeolicus]|nr:DUF4178 domain-containing protein [Aquifex aeolicus]